MGNDMNAAGPSRTSPREPATRESDGGRARAGRPDGGRPDAASGDPDARQPDLRWPDAREPDPLDATWQSVDQFFTDQPEPDAAVTAPEPSAAPPTGPTRQSAPDASTRPSPPDASSGPARQAPPHPSYGPARQAPPDPSYGPARQSPPPEASYDTTPPGPLPGLAQQPPRPRFEKSPPPSSYEPTPASPLPGFARQAPPPPHACGSPGPGSGPATGPAPEQPAARGTAVPTLGAPFHSGPKPPLYAPEPLELPSVRQDPTAALTPDMVVDGAGYGALTVRAASVRGDSHRYQGEPRQDSLAVVRLGAPGADGLLLLAVADGVGSAARSHIGSQEACRLAAIELDGLSAELSEALRSGDQPRFAVLADTAVGRVATLLAHRAREHGDDPAAYATTLRALLVPLDLRVRTRGFLAVGDGGTALLRDGAWNLSLTDPEHDGDGMIDTRTAALPHGHRARARLLAPALPGDVLVLCTDGLSTPLAGDAGMRDFLASGWGMGTVPAPADFLWQLQYRVKSYDDDRTAVVLWEAAP
ncbi:MULTISPECIES: PP2C family serine/threonine-protein phosphatase [unclassified Streptomyces]|uniref:PP2C family serine/threonine-protein phosphatase n=1 Tax=unclassified Streptomyces TaxID=2593676 RepID=UPI0022513C8F|nr:MULTISPECIES: protein phosphatase 2C domain-containing protein [unclassified Streptomyces]MCX4990476.1 protein phosphatase 2C domain-containing protein [Streptomyces sp. NBC_00568]MCX5004293.1 protein phosphatase 2C domain-containing protein [Streptomyces sp. NBC_00638]